MAKFNATNSFGLFCPACDELMNVVIASQQVLTLRPYCYICGRTWLCTADQESKIVMYSPIEDAGNGSSEWLRDPKGEVIS